MNEGKLDVVKQEMARLNIDILVISELKWMRMDKFDSDDHYIYYCEGSLRRNGLTLIVNKKVQNAVFGCNCQNNRMSWSPFQSKPFKIQVSHSMLQTLTLKKLKLNVSVKTYNTF